MACTPFDGFSTATEWLTDEIYLRASWRSIWLNLIPKDEYPMEHGTSITTFTMGRNEPETEEEHWERITSSPTCAGASDSKAPGNNGYYDEEIDSASGFCTTCWNDTKWGHKAQTYSPEQFGLRGPIVCQDDLLFNHNPAQFLELYLRALAKRSQRSLENRLANVYTHLAPKWVATASFQQYSTGGSLTNGVAPNVPDLTGLPIATSEITQEMLDEVAQNLVEVGATEPDSDGWISLSEDGPLFSIFVGMRASQQLQLNNSEFRQDYRWAEPSALIKRLGATRTIKNFRHVINLYPPRYNFFTGLGYIRVPTWLMVATTKGYQAQLNPSWRTAAFEGLWVLSPWVFHNEPIRPRNAAAGVSWIPKNYMGEWMWMTGGHEICDPSSDAEVYDPIKKLGRHFAEVKWANKPIFPEFGSFILFKRCPTTAFETVTCAS